MPQQITSAVNWLKYGSISSSKAGSNWVGVNVPMPLSDANCANTTSPAPKTQTRRFEVPQSTAIHSTCAMCLPRVNDAAVNSHQLSGHHTAGFYPSLEINCHERSSKDVSSVRFVSICFPLIKDAACIYTSIWRIRKVFSLRYRVTYLKTTRLPLAPRSILTLRTRTLCSLMQATRPACADTGALG